MEFFADSLVNGFLQSSMMGKGIVIVQLAASVVRVAVILGKIKETTGSLTDRAAETLNRFVEAVAVMIVTSCVIPILVLLFFLWVIKQLTGVDLRDYAPRRRPRHAEREDETQQRVSI